MDYKGSAINGCENNCTFGKSKYKSLNGISTDHSKVNTKRCTKLYFDLDTMK